jgi:hypothetical protein
MKALRLVKLSREIYRPRHVEINRPWHAEINTVAKQREGRPSAALTQVVAAFGRHHHVEYVIDWQPVLISTCHGLLISTCCGLVISTDGSTSLDALTNLCRVP